MSNLDSPKTGCTSTELKLARFCSRFALPFETRTQSRTAEQAERRGRVHLLSAEAKPALAAKQQQSLLRLALAPCILLTLTHHLRFIPNPYQYTLFLLCPNEDLITIKRFTKISLTISLSYSLIPAISSIN